MMRPFWLLLLPLALAGCDWTARQANALGDYMPVIGDRCENWQCITSEGQARSDAVKAEQQREKQLEQQPSSPQPQAEPTPIYPDAVPQPQERKSFNPPDTVPPASPEQHLNTDAPI